LLGNISGFDVMQCDAIDFRRERESEKVVEVGDNRVAAKFRDMTIVTPE
jgi:hypothetical protein